VKIAENYELWHPEWYSLRRVQKSWVPKIAKKFADSEIKSTKPADKEVNLFDGDGLLLLLQKMLQ
jgi:hypothetical protein